MAELAATTPRSGSLADVRRRRRRPDRGRDRRPDHRAGAPVVGAQLQALRPHARPGCCLFEGGEEILATFGDRLSGKATQELEQARGRHPGQEPGHRRRPRTRSSSDARRRDAVAVPDQGVGGRCAGVAARRGARRGGRRRASTARGGSRCSRLHPPGPSRGLRRRRRDGARRPPGRRRGRHAAGIHVAEAIKRRRRGRRDREAVQVSRPGQHGDRGPVPGDRRLQGDPGSRASSAG